MARGQLSRRLRCRRCRWLARRAMAPAQVGRQCSARPAPDPAAPCRRRRVRRQGCGLACRAWCRAPVDSSSTGPGSPQADRHLCKGRAVGRGLRPALLHECAVAAQPAAGSKRGSVGAGQQAHGRHLQPAAALHVARNLPGVPARPWRLAPGQHPGEELRGMAGGCRVQRGGGARAALDCQPASALLDCQPASALLPASPPRKLRSLPTSPRRAKRRLRVSRGRRGCVSTSADSGPFTLAAAARRARSAHQTPASRAPCA